MDPTATRRLGRTDVHVTQLGFGTAPLGDLFTVLQDHDAQAALDAAWRCGIRYFDTAPWYGRGQSEHRTGRSLYRHKRDSFVLSTKVGRVLRASRDTGRFEGDLWSGGLPFIHRFDYSYDGIMRSFEDSHQRLGMSYIDLLLIHDLDYQHHGTDAAVGAHLAALYTSGWRALSELKEHGHIRGIGAGVNELNMIPRFLDLVDLDFFLVALPYTLLDQDVLDKEFPACVARGIGFVIGAVFASGILAAGAKPGAKYAYKDPTPEVLDRVRRIEAVCGRHGVPLAAAAMQFPLGHPSVASVIPGALDRSQVERNVETFRHDIPAAFWDELKHERLLRADAPLPLEAAPARL
jgi:D-threo-aldose 1-dehydrogenase